MSQMEVVFMGEHEVAIDSKNRIMIPSKWRDYIGTDAVLTEGFEGALELRSKAAFMSHLHHLTSNDPFSKHVRVLKRRILGGSHEITLDKWFRFGIPSHLSKNKNYGNSVIMRGNGDSIEIWSKEEFDSWKNDDENSMEKAAEAIAVIKS